TGFAGYWKPLPANSPVPNGDLNKPLGLIQSLDRLKAIVLVEDNLETTTDTCMGHVGPENCRRKTYPPPVDAARQHITHHTLIKTLILIGRYRQIHDHSLQFKTPVFSQKGCGSFRPACESWAEE